MADLSLVVGQTATGVMTFSESTPPADGAVASDNAAFVTASLDADKVTWHAVCVGAPTDGTMGIANISYTGTSVAPDVGPAVVAPISVGASQAPVAETGNFNAGSATIA